MHKVDVVAEAGSTHVPPRSGRDRDVDVVTFLQTALTVGAVDVSELEILARAAGLLGEGQRISQAKQFKRAKATLGIRSVRQGFGPRGAWAWVLPPPTNACDRRRLIWPLIGALRSPALGNRDGGRGSAGRPGGTPDDRRKRLATRRQIDDTPRCRYAYADLLPVLASRGAFSS